MLCSTHGERLGYGGLTKALALKYTSQGHVNNAQIELQRCVADVPLVKRILLVRGQETTAVPASAIAPLSEDQRKCPKDCEGTVTA
jgi:hypothetical protein